MMTPERARAEVCRQFCLPEKDMHDDVCVVLRGEVDYLTGVLRDLRGNLDVAIAMQS